MRLNIFSVPLGNVDGLYPKPFSINDVAAAPGVIGQLEIQHKTGVLNGDPVQGKRRVVRLGAQADNRVEIRLEFCKQTHIRAHKYQPNGEILVVALKILQDLETKPFKAADAGKEVPGNSLGNEVFHFTFQCGALFRRDIGAADDEAGSVFGG